MRLAAKSDVVVQNFAPRVMPNLGLGYERLRERNPAIILVSMPAFGLSGPYRDRIAYGPGIDAMSGFCHLTGYADGPPMKPGNFFCDQNAGAPRRLRRTCRALVPRGTGEGQHIELAMIEGEFQVLGDATSISRSTAESAGEAVTAIPGWRRTRCSAVAEKTRGFGDRGRQRRRIRGALRGHRSARTG